MSAGGGSPRGIARFDSAAGMARALGAFLHGRRFDSLTGSPATDRLLPLVNLLPRRPREWFYAFAGTVEAVGRLVELPGVAHTLVFTTPDQLAAVTRQFLREETIARRPCR